MASSILPETQSKATPASIAENAPSLFVSHGAAIAVQCKVARLACVPSGGSTARVQPHRYVVREAESMQNDPGRTRTCNPRLRRPMPYPLGHGANAQDGSTSFQRSVCMRAATCCMFWISSFRKLPLNDTDASRRTIPKEHASRSSTGCLV